MGCVSEQVSCKASPTTFLCCLPGELVCSCPSSAVLGLVIEIYRSLWHYEEGVAAVGFASIANLDRNKQSKSSAQIVIEVEASKELREFHFLHGNVPIFSSNSM